jgi:tetratricopeptide (TPR) repeat protein
MPRNHSKRPLSSERPLTSGAEPAVASTAAETGLRKRLLGALLIVLLTLLVYVPAMQAGFIWDDDTFLTQNPLIKADDGLWRFWFTREPPDYFPLTSTLLWLEWRLWGMNPAGYHVVNVLLHAISAVLIWRVLRQLRVPEAWLAAVIFAVHPVNVESVAWITECKNVLPMALYALTLLLFLKYQESADRRWYVLSVAAFLLALLAKTSVAMAPFVLLGCAWWLHGRVSRRDLLDSLPFFVLAGLLGLATVWFQYHRAIGEDIVRDDSFPARLACAGWAVWFYLYKALLPWKLSFVYPRWSIDPSNVLSYVPLLLLAGGLAILWRYRAGWSRPALFAIAYFVVMLFPVLGFFNIYFMRYSLVADHWQYFSIIGIIALAVGLSARACARLQGAARHGRFALAAGIIGLLSVLTWRQAGVYKDLDTLWRDTLAKNPACFMAHNNLGSLLESRGQPSQAMHHYAEALRIKPDFAYAHNNLGSMLAGQGRLDEAIRHYKEALRLKPNYADAHSNFGVALGRQGNLREAIDQYTQALQLRPDHVEARYNLGLALEKQGRIQQAIDQYEQVLRLDPGHVKTHNNLASALIRLGKTDQAITHYRRGMELKPDWPESYNNLAWLLATYHEERFRDGPEAVRLAQRACELTHDELPEFLDTLAAAYAEAGRFDQAIRSARRGIDLATHLKQEALAGDIRNHLRLYEAGRPYREARP